MLELDAELIENIDAALNALIDVARKRAFQEGYQEGYQALPCQYGE